MPFVPSNSTIINWNGFLENIVKPSRANQESCAWIFVDVPSDVWHVFEVKNIGLKEKSPEFSFAPDKKEFARVKRMAKKRRLTKVGNVHTHVVLHNNEREVKNQMRPSEADLKYARKFNDIIRAIVVVQFTDLRKRGEIRGIIWFDQYGNILRREQW